MYSTLWRMEFITSRVTRINETDEKVKNIKVRAQNANIYIIYILSGATR